jgi:putative ABC transport system permease protein
VIHPTDIRRGNDEEPKPVTVVGLVGDARSRLSETPRAQVYLPMQQRFVQSVTVIARTNDGRRMAAPIRALVTSMNPDLPVRSQTLEEAAVFVLLPQRIAAALSGGLGAVGLLLAAMGIYGVTAYVVARRTREIGIRIALGASPPAIVMMVVNAGMALVIAGAAVGLLFAVGLDVALTRTFYGFPPLDALVLAGVAILFTSIGLAACYVPVRRATAVNPAVVLRAD